MSLVGEQVLLRIYLQSADRAPHVPTYERIVKAARKENLAGATVLRGILGAGYHGIIQGSAWSVVQHVPIIVEMVDSAEKIAKFVQGPLDRIMVGGMLTLERAAVIMYRQRTQDQPNSLHLAAMLKPLSTMPAITPGSHMKIQQNGVLLRVFIGDSDKFQHKPLYEAIVQKTRELGLAGATVLRGTEGRSQSGASGNVQRSAGGHRDRRYRRTHQAPAAVPGNDGAGRDDHDGVRGDSDVSAQQNGRDPGIPRSGRDNVKTVLKPKPRMDMRG
jgi:PII-like signaling protein